MVRLLLRPGTWYENQRERFTPFDRLVETDEGWTGATVMAEWPVQYQPGAGSVVVASGAFEQPAVFRYNDLPGIMLASAAQRLMSQITMMFALAHRAPLAAEPAGLRRVVALVERLLQQRHTRRDS